ncbi:MAG: ImmA/IrrE family metallo-endopeptidase, partial [Polyangiaceae bacterium]|nr:ImmA/IrrE family metallo-endopeptidase [Polyangiaceae bacterium]
AGPLLSVQGLLESLGVHVTWAAFETPGITAVSMYEREALPVIVLNRASPRAGRPMSRRAALAHELCHLLHDGQAVDLLTMVSRYDARDPIEQRANGFAPSFLAPRTMLNLTSQTPEALVRELAEGWGFTMEGAAWHAKNCGLIDGESAEALAGSGTQIGRGAFEPHEPQFLGMAGGLILSLVEEAVAKDVISEGRLREILSGE